VEQVARGITPRSTSVEFWVKDGEHLTRIDAQLPSTGSLGPLFFAFGLISQEELQAGTGRDDVADTNFLEWLRDTVYEAVKIAERHESLKLRIREARANIEHRYQLASLQVRAALTATASCKGPGMSTSCGPEAAAPCLHGSAQLVQPGP